MATPFQAPPTLAQILFPLESTMMVPLGGADVKSESAGVPALTAVAMPPKWEATEDVALTRPSSLTENTETPAAWQSMKERVWPAGKFMARPVPDAEPAKKPVVVPSHGPGPTLTRP